MTSSKSRPIGEPSAHDLSSAGPRELAELVGACAGDEGLMSAIGGIYRSADAEIAAVGAACLGCGACCRFDLLDHRLYVSCAELAYLTGRPGQHAAAPTATGRCPYQLGFACTARSRRPLGCRTFYCDGAHRASRNDIYERYHKHIRSAHHARGLEYAYVELTRACAALARPAEHLPLTESTHVRSMEKV